MTRNPEVLPPLQGHGNLPALLADAPPVLGQAARMVYRPDLLSLRTVGLVVPSGVSVLAAMRKALRDAGHSPSILRGARIDVNGAPVPRAEWGTRLLRPGDLASLHIPVRGGGGSGGKNPLGTLLSLAVVVAAAYLTYGASAGVGWAGGLAGSLGVSKGVVVAGIAGLSMVAMWGVSALFPPAVAKLGSASGSLSAEKTWAISGTQNQVDPYGPIPVVLGKVRFAHRMATRGYTLLQGQTVIARILYVVMGRNKVTDQRVGDTPLAQVTGARTVVHENWQGEPLELVENVFESSFDASLTYSGGEVTKTGQADATGCSLEIYYPQGLVRIDSKNRRYTSSVTYLVELTASGSTTRFPAFGTMSTTGGTVNIQSRALPAYSPVSETDMTRTTGSFGVHIVADGEGVAFSGALQIVSGSWDISWYAVSNGSGGYAWARGSTSVSAPLIVSADFSVSVSGTAITVGAGEVRQNVVTHSAATVTPQRRGISITYPTPGKWNVHVKRLTGDANADSTSETVLNSGRWVKLRSFVPGRPVVYEGFPLTLVEAEFIANDALDGVIDAYSALMESYAPVPQDGGGWADEPTNNPASLGYLLTSGRYTDTPLEAEDMHDDVWRDFHAWCATMGWEYNGVITTEGTVADVLAPVLRAARGGYAIIDGMHAVAWDAPDRPVTMIYGPRNSWGFKASKTMPERMPHGRRFSFLNADADYEEDERVVYADGYNADTATYIIDDEQEGVTSPDLIYTHGRLHIADSIHRAETFEWQTDFSHLMVQKGSVVDHVHDALLTGIAQARVIGTIPDPEDATRIIGVVIDEDVTMEAGATYMLRQYTYASMNTTWAVETIPGTGRELYWPVVDAETGEHLSTPAVTSPQFDDMVVFGVSGRETLRLVVTGIMPEQDYVARITAQMDGTDMYAAASGPVPPFVSGITQPSRWSKGKPATPSVLGLRSDEAVLQQLSDGSLVPRIAVAFEAQMLRGVVPVTVRVQVREQTSGAEWLIAGSAPASEGVVYATDVAEGVAYEVRVQAVSSLGIGSGWSTAVTHTVIGKLTDPPDVPSLLRDGSMLRWTYPDAPLDLAGFLVRFARNASASWNTAQPAHEGTLTTAEYDMSRYAGAETLWLVRAVDTGGRMSSTPARLVADIGGPEITNIVDEIDLRAMGWPGSHDGEVDGEGNLSAIASTLAYGGGAWAEQTVILDLSQPVPVDTHLPLTYEFGFLMPDEAMDAALSVSVEYDGQLLSLGYAPPSSVLAYGCGSWANLQATTDFGAQAYPDPVWSPMPASVSGPQAGGVHQLRISLLGGDGEVRIRQCRVLLDVPDQIEEFEDVAVPDEGVRLVLERNYRSIRQVLLTVQDDGGSGASARIIDKSIVPGPLVQVLDATGAPVAGTIDARVRGVRGAAA